ncbi:hypothetical protein [Pseudomonas citronellolis]|nr:hypothetical protein [Pseudomonas citronellolis]UXJ53545.1 hypothetical protein N5P21_04800 [Pseudomonas citronellolis]
MMISSIQYRGVSPIVRAAEEKKRLTTLEQRVSNLDTVVVAGKRLA